MAEKLLRGFGRKVEADMEAGMEAIVGVDFNKEVYEKGLMQQTLARLGMVNVF